MIRISRNTALKALLATALSVIASVSIVLIIVPILGGHPDGPGFWMSMFCPLLIAGPATTWQYHQRETIIRQRDELAHMHVELESMHFKLRHLHEELLWKSRRDGLTGGLNREAIFAALADCAAKASGPAVLLVLDADHFKHINDQFGHQVGDEALCRIAAILDGALDGKGIWGRIGGEEFLVFLTISAADVLQVADEIRRRIGQTGLRSDGRQVPLSVSIGGAGVEGVFDPSALFKQADENLYRAKSAGRDQVVMDGKRPDRLTV